MLLLSLGVRTWVSLTTLNDVHYWWQETFSKHSAKIQLTCNVLSSDGQAFNPSWSGKMQVAANRRTPLWNSAGKFIHCWNFCVLLVAYVGILDCTVCALLLSFLHVPPRKIFLFSLSALGVRRAGLFSLLERLPHWLHVMDDSCSAEILFSTQRSQQNRHPTCFKRIGSSVQPDFFHEHALHIYCVWKMAVASRGLTITGDMLMSQLSL